MQQYYHPRTQAGGLLCVGDGEVGRLDLRPCSGVCRGVQAVYGEPLGRSLVPNSLDRVPVPVIPIQARTLHQLKKGGSILKFEAPNL